MTCPLGIRINRILLYSPLLLSTQSAQEYAEHLTFIVVVIKPAVRMYYLQLLIGLNFDAMPLM